MVEKKATLEIHVQPGARTNEIVGLKDGVLQVRVTAPPRRGQANQALVELLSRRLDLPKSRVSIVHGHTSRNKVVSVFGLDADDVWGMLQLHSRAEHDRRA